jgi:hypothetical protein
VNRFGRQDEGRSNGRIGQISRCAGAILARRGALGLAFGQQAVDLLARQLRQQVVGAGERCRRRCRGNRGFVQGIGRYGGLTHGDSFHTLGTGAAAAVGASCALIGRVGPHHNFRARAPQTVLAALAAALASY